MLVELQKKLVYSIISKYSTPEIKDDLFQAGMVGALKAYQKYDHIHDYILIGYEEDNILYSVGYTKTGRYEEFTITFDEYLDSLINSTNSFIDINTCKYHPEGNFAFNNSNFCQELSDYINSTNSKAIGCNKIYGIKSIEELKSYVFDDVSEIDIRYIKILLEHKNLMKLRLEYVYKDSISDIPEKYKKVSEEANRMYLLSIKYNITKNKDILESIENGFNLILNLEKELLPRVFNDVNCFS